MSIVHGLSEYRICCSIKSNLRLKHEIIARDKGKHSIQVTGLQRLLSTDDRFIDIKNFIRHFPDVECKRNKLTNFRLFIIMDIDDCTNDQRRSFINKEMFKKHWMYDYIHPIYNDPNLEATMASAKIEVRKKQDYVIVFPTNHGDLDIPTAKEFCENLRSCRCSNMQEYIDHCISIAERDINSANVPST